MTLRYFLALALAALPLNAAHGQAGPSVTSTGQSGGVTAYSIGNLVINEAPKVDSVTEKLAGALSISRNHVMGQIKQLLQAPAYTVLVDLPREKAPDRVGDVMYQLYAVADAEDAEGIFIPICGLDDGPAVGGSAVYLSTLDGTAKATMRMLTKADIALVQPICDSLAKPVTTLSPGRHRQSGGADMPSVFDFLSRDSHILMIMLQPGNLQGQDIEKLVARYYWASALAMRYSRVPDQDRLTDNPEIYAQIPELMAGGTATIQMPMAARYYTHEGMAAYPPEAEREFGSRITELDSNWLRYLAGATLTVGGEQKALMLNGKPAKVLKRFSLAEIGTPAFWRSATDYALASEMVSCIAGRFLEDNYRVRAAELDLGRCAEKETRWSQ